jgi:hypothetical protein
MCDPHPAVSVSPKQDDIAIGYFPIILGMGSLF